MIGNERPAEDPAAERDRKDIKAVQRAAVDLLIRFHIVYKIARLYEPNNEMLQEQSRLMFEALSSLIGTRGQAAFSVRQGSFFLNGLRIKFVLQNYSIFKFVLEEFRKREIGGVRFRGGLTLDGLVRFMAVLAKKEKKAHGTFEELAAEVAEAGIDGIDLEKILPNETFPSAEKNTSNLYFLSIFHLKETFAKDQQDKKLRLTTTRRLMQSIFNHIVDNEAFVYGLTNIKNYDEYTLNHSVNVCMLSIALGRRLGLNRGELVDLGMAAFLHDLGKLDTPLEILNKPARLSDEEREIMEMHPTQGAGKLIQLKEFKRLPLRAIHVALEHHIKEDDTGYPHTFKKQTTNLFSKIVKVIDYFDAVTTKRVYRKKVFTRAEALSLMMEHIGTEFNPVILKAFINMMGAFPIGTVVYLDTGEIGIVFNTNPDPRHVLRPGIKLITDRDGNRIDGKMADLSEQDPVTDRFARNIVRPLDPNKYGINVSDYFLAQAR
ncbi:MAG TPA: HD domain-containing phosphohydrolase [Acidobacteriota bacterium]|nr:HD domain-containing phosphohydrolase [Acidobacteriota bacterium]